MSSKAAKRYANAFLETAIELDVLESIKDDILLIRETFKTSPELRIFLKSPVVKKDNKKEALSLIFGKRVQDITVNLLNILSDKNREVLLEDITNHFVDLYNIHHGIIEVVVYSASTLSKTQQKNLLTELEEYTGKKVRMTISVDESLIGGLKVRIQDTVIDGTVKHKLSQLKESFTEAAVQ